MRLLGEIKKTYGCMSPTCHWEGEITPSILDFHHIDPDTKESNILKMIGFSRAAIAKEVNKCVVLCANCHRLAHAEGISQFEQQCQVSDDLMVLHG
jgi:hypothetical protein